MSDEPSADLKALYSQHQATGEPSAASVARVRARVLSAATEPGALPRSWLRHEVMAIAAVLMVMVGAQGLYVLLRTAPTKDDAASAGDLPSPADDAVARADDAVARADDAVSRSDDAVTLAQAAEVAAVVSAYQSGDLEGALRLAAKGGPPCKALVPKLEQVSRLSQRLSSLSAAEVAQVAALDQELAAGRVTALGQRVAQAAPSRSAVAASLHEQARAALRAKDLTRAIALGEACTRTDPGFAPCHKLLGTAWAQRAVREGDPGTLEHARRAYQRFLELAPADDEDVARVRVILETERAAREPTADQAAIERLFTEAHHARVTGQWVRAVELARQVKSLDPRHGGALALLTEARDQARDVYLRAYQQKDFDPARAMTLFGEVVSMTLPDDELHLKAQARLDELRAPQ
jgi:tetratricopeptide (TPR) repeat protein